MPELDFLFSYGKEFLWAGGPGGFILGAELRWRMPGTVLSWWVFPIFALFVEMLGQVFALYPALEFKFFFAGAFGAMAGFLLPFTLVWELMGLLQLALYAGFVVLVVQVYGGDPSGAGRAYLPLIYSSGVTVTMGIVFLLTALRSQGPRT